jgi:hypothetical protein
MTAIPPFPDGVEYFLDTRGGGRALRVTLHPEAGVVVLSTWRGEECVASFRLPIEDAARLAGHLRDVADRSLGHASQI